MFQNTKIENNEQSVTSGNDIINQPNLHKNKNACQQATTTTTCSTQNRRTRTLAQRTQTRTHHAAAQRAEKSIF